MSAGWGGTQWRQPAQGNFEYWDGGGWVGLDTNPAASPGMPGAGDAGGTGTMRDARGNYWRVDAGGALNFWDGQRWKASEHRQQQGTPALGGGPSRLAGTNATSGGGAEGDIAGWLGAGQGAQPWFMGDSARGPTATAATSGDGLTTIPAANQGAAQGQGSGLIGGPSPAPSATQSARGGTYAGGTDPNAEYLRRVGTYGYRAVDPLDATYYTNQNPQAAWWQFGEALAPGDRNFQNYLAGNYERLMSQYYRAAEANPNLQLNDFLTTSLGQQIRNEYQLQAPQLRGIDYRLTDPGRFNTGY